MRSGIAGLLALGSVAVLFGCEDPLEPKGDTALAGTQAAPPRAPTDPLSWPVSASQIDISWPDTPNETGWEIHRSIAGASGTFSQRAQTAANIITYSDVGLIPNTEYCYRIRSFKTSGRKTTFGAFSTTTCATTFGPPRAPSNVSVTPRLFGAVDVAWTNSSTNTEGFWVERAGGPEGPWERLLRVPSWQLSYGDQGRSIEQQVCYRIVAVNVYGETPSGVDCTTPPANPGPLAATAPDEHTISLSWVDNSRAEDGFELQRAGEDIVWNVIATLPANTTGYVDRSVGANTQYWYQVRATKDGGFSPFSNAVSAAAASTTPNPPSFVGAQPFSSSGVTAYWALDSKLAEGYRAERSTNNGSTWTDAPTIPGQNWLTEEGLPSEQALCYRVFAFNRVGDSPASTMACTTPPAAPANLVTISIDDQTVEHQWADNSGVEDGYELWLYTYYEGYYDPYYFPVALPANTTSYRTVPSEYVYGIVALKDGGYSDWAFPDWGATSASLQRRVLNHGIPPARAQRAPPVPLELMKRRTPR